MYLRFSVVFNAPQLPWVAVLTFSTQKLHHLSHFLRLMETQTPGPSDYVQRGDEWTELQNYFFHLHLESTGNSQDILRLHLQMSHGKIYAMAPLISFHQGKTWSGSFVVQNVPLEAVLLDRSKVFSWSICFGISVSSGGLVSTFLTFPCMFVGSLTSILLCWSIWGGLQWSFSMEGLFREEQQSTQSWSEGFSRSGAQAVCVLVLLLSHGKRGNSLSHSTSLSGIIIW